MKRMRNHKVIWLVLLVLAMSLMLTGCEWLDALFGTGGRSTPGIAACIDFSTLTPGTIYAVGDTFNLQGIKITVLPFEYYPSGSGMAYNGNATVTATTSAGGALPEMNLNNVNLGFDFNGEINSIDLLFADLGGNCNIQTNIHFLNVEDFTNASVNLPGIMDNIVGGLGTPGSISLQGPMKPEPFHLDPALGDFGFVIGGQELWIDEICSGV